MSRKLNINATSYIPLNHQLINHNFLPLNSYFIYNPSSPNYFHGFQLPPPPPSDHVQANQTSVASAQVAVDHDYHENVSNYNTKRNPPRVSKHVRIEVQQPSASNNNNVSGPRRMRRKASLTCHRRSDVVSRRNQCYYSCDSYKGDDHDQKINMINNVTTLMIRNIPNKYTYVPLNTLLISSSCST